MKNRPISIMSIMGGFTLVELMVATALAGLGMIAIYKAFSSQGKILSSQDQAVTMQQDLRASLDIMLHDIRMAGYDHENVGFTAIDNATASGFAFRADLNEDGDTNDANERLGYRLYVTVTDNVTRLGRQPGAGAIQPVAENIEALDFVYLDNVGNPFPFPIASANLGNIRSVEITVIARTARTEKDYTDDTAQYTNRYPLGHPNRRILLDAGYLNQVIPGTSPPQTNRQYRRRVFTTVIYSRNLGL